ncbi:hypothetical protein Tco_0794286 [Tanacetum coccineum]
MATYQSSPSQTWRVLDMEDEIETINPDDRLCTMRIIENGATLPKTKIVEGVMTEMPITIAKEKTQRRLEVKARIPPPYTGNFMPPTPNLSFTGLDEFANKLVVENCKAMSSEEKPKEVRKNDDALIIEEWVSDSEEENVSQTKTEKKTVKPSIAKIEFVKPKQHIGKLLNKLRNIGKTLTVQEAIKEIGTI